MPAASAAAAAAVSSSPLVTGSSVVSQSAWSFVVFPPSSAASKIFVILLSYILHLAVFHILPVSCGLPPAGSPPPSHKRYLQLKCLYMSTFHALVGILAPLIFLAVFGTDLTNENRTWNITRGTGDEWIPLAICNSMGYFLYDSTLMFLYPKLFLFSSLLHHVIIFAAFGLGVFTEITMAIHFFFLLEEFSTPFLNLKSIYHEDERLNKIFSGLFAVTFFLSRIVYGTFILFGTCFTTYPTFLFRTYSSSSSIFSFELWNVIIAFVFGVLTRILNFYWMALIVKKVIDVANGKSVKETGRDSVEAFSKKQNGADKLHENNDKVSSSASDHEENGTSNGESLKKRKSKRDAE